MITKICAQSYELSRIYKNIFIFFVVALFLLDPPILFSQERPDFVYSNIARLDSSYIIYQNPRIYNVEMSFEIIPNPAHINKDQDLKVWIPIPREWDSQKNVKIVFIQPKTHTQFTDPEYGNKIFYWDFGKYPERPSYQVNIKARLLSYEIQTKIDSSDVKPYEGLESIITLPHK